MTASLLIPTAGLFDFLAGSQEDRQWEQGLLMNERVTENIVRDELRRLGYFKLASKISVEEQRSEIEAVKRLMRAASKSGHGGIGAPEFIISCPANPDFLLIIECKADLNNHASVACKERLAG